MVKAFVGLIENEGSFGQVFNIGGTAGLAAIFVGRSDTLTLPAVIIPVIVAILLMGIYLAQLRVYPGKEFSLLRDKPYTPVLVELTYKRQILQVILDLGLIDGFVKSRNFDFCSF